MSGFSTIDAYGSLKRSGVVAGELTITTTGNIDNLVIGGISVLRMNNATLATIRGIVAGFAGQQLTIVSVGAGHVDLAHQNAGSTAANRLVNVVTSANSSLAAGVGSATYVYDATTARWRMTTHAQGARITPTFAAGDYTGNGAMTWTVAAGDVQSMEYILNGKELTVAFGVNTTSVGGTPNVQLRIANGQWGGFTVASLLSLVLNLTNDGAGLTIPGYMGVGSVFGDTNLLHLHKMDNTNWTASTDTTGIFGFITFSVT